MMTSLVLLVPIVVSVTAAPLEKIIDSRLINQGKDPLSVSPAVVLDTFKMDSKRSSRKQPTKGNDDSKETKTSQFLLPIGSTENRLSTSPRTLTESSIIKKGARKPSIKAVNKTRNDVKTSLNNGNKSLSDEHELHNDVHKSQNDDKPQSDGRKSQGDVKKSEIDVRKVQSNVKSSQTDGRKSGVRKIQTNVKRSQSVKSQTVSPNLQNEVKKSQTDVKKPQNDLHTSQTHVHKLQTDLKKSPDELNKSQNNVKNPSQTSSTEGSIPKTKVEKDSQESELKGKLAKRSRKHKSFYYNYPFVPQIHHHYPHYDPSFDDCNFGTEERNPAGKKKYQDSNIYYIRLPPTPYMFVPGLGYVSQPPRYSPPQPPPPPNPPVTHGRPFRPARPPTIYQPHVNPFIKVPIDFISNGKPTSVYQWQDTKTASRPENQITNLDKAPYVFNGRPSSIYLLRPDGSQTLPQPIRYNDFQNNGYY